MALLIAVSRLDYLKQERSRRYIAREANISYYRLSQLDRYGIALPSNENKRLYNLYSRQTYADLKLSGMSAEQARRYAGSSIETMDNTFERMKNITEHLAGGALAKKAKALRDHGFAVDYEELWGESLEVLKQGLRDSNKSIEQWENY